MDKIYSTVVESPHLYDIEYFAYSFDDEDNSKSYIDLHLKKGGEECKLRFWGAGDLQIEKAFLTQQVACTSRTFQSAG